MTRFLAAVGFVLAAAHVALTLQLIPFAPGGTSART